MKRILVWDLPTRMFHWLLAAGFLTAFTIGSAVSHHDATFPLHMVVGLVLGLMVVLRLVWGFVGTRHARFKDFLYGPKAVIAYMRGVRSGEGKPHVGHNPGSSWAIYAMLSLVLGMVVTGLLAVDGVHEAGDLHSALSTILLIVVIAHVLGVIVHTWRHGENITMSMVHGKKDADEAYAISGTRPLIALVFLLLTGLWGWRLGAGYDGATRRLTVPIVGAQLQLGEADGGEHGGAAPAHDDDD